MKFATLIAFVLSIFTFAAQESSSLTAQDLATADGSLRAGLLNGKIYSILTAPDTGAVLEPDSWSGEEESVSWNRWLVDFDNDLFTNWTSLAKTDGQQTVQVRIVNGKINSTPGTYLSESGANNAEQRTAFETAIAQALELTLKNAPPVPQTKNSLKEIRMAMTFMRDKKMTPRFGREQLGFMVVRTPAGDNINVYGRLKDGQAPGIQIISEREGGNISVTELDQFIQKCREIDAAQTKAPASE